MKRYKRKFEEAFPPNNVSWNVYVIFSKLPNLLKDLTSEIGNMSSVFFESDAKGARGKATMEEDYKGKLIVFNSAKNKYLEVLIDTKNPSSTKWIRSVSGDSLKNIALELNTK
jgi:hypothetical protein